MKKTLYQKWRRGETNFGAFHTHIVQAYQIADIDNMKILEQAYPEIFVHTK